MVLRYHPAGNDFNYEAPPVLLFPGICENINQFLTCSTPKIKELFDLELPDNLADWAIGDENIENAAFFGLSFRTITILDIIYGKWVMILGSQIIEGLEWEQCEVRMEK